MFPNCRLYYYYYYYYHKSLNLIKRANISNQDYNSNVHDYRMVYSLRQHLWPALSQKLWHYNNMCINNCYYVNKLSTFVFPYISIVTHFNSILNDILFVILHLHIIIRKWQTKGTNLQARRRPKGFLKCPCI